MFAKTIIDSDDFIEMPLSTQALYFHLSMRADDEGFINNPKRIQRMVGAADDDIKVLIAKKFIIPFESGIVVIKHWKIHNYIQKDRFKETLYLEEKSQLEVKENNGYRLRAPVVDTVCIQSVSNMDTQVSIVKSSQDESKGSKEEKPRRETRQSLFERLVADYNLSMVVQDKITEWLQYKTERKEPYKEQGMKSLLRQIENNAQQYGDRAICNLMDESMANGWRGIIFDKLSKQSAAKKPSGNVFLDMLDGNKKYNDYIDEML